MTINLNINIGDDRIGEILRLMKTVLKKENIMSAELDTLTAQVAQNTQLEGSAVTLIRGLASQIAAAANDPAAITALSQQLNTSATALAAAITVNTPAAPAAPAPTGTGTDTTTGTASA